MHGLPIAKLKAWLDEDTENRTVKIVEVRVPAHSTHNAYRESISLAKKSTKYGKLQLVGVFLHHRYGLPVSARFDTAVCSTTNAMLAFAAGEDFRTLINKTFRSITPGAGWTASLTAFVEVCHAIPSALCHCDLPEKLQELL